jgi:hypothetical protein
MLKELLNREGVHLDAGYTLFNLGAAVVLVGGLSPIAVLSGEVR